ncbi:TPA: hypothetical protein HA296_01095 [Candidatus Woesearchaeota archaeon]|nr:hypothetical protein [Candidatus Woesearchaeota archaeon]
MSNNKDLWKDLCSYDNLFLAYKKARKHKTTKYYVIDFEKDIEDNLLLLRSELLLHSYTPKPLINFIIRDPKTRKISKSDFRDRVVHHALCNIIEPRFDKSFIHDSYANRAGKGTLKAVERFDFFKRKASKNGAIPCYVLKADVKKYFETVDHDILLRTIQKKINDQRVIWLIRKILGNPLGKERSGKGMPLGNLTSQFFANVYLNELDQFVKQKLRAKYGIRDVDDFVILHPDRCILMGYKEEINRFLKKMLDIELHPNKSKIILLGNRLTFLGFRVFYYHKLLKKSSIRKMKANFERLKEEYKRERIGYDTIYDFFEGWMAYAKNANTYTLRKKILVDFESDFSGKISAKEVNRYLMMQMRPAPCRETA